MHNRPLVNDSAVLVFDHTFMLPWLASRKDPTAKGHSDSNSKAGSETVFEWRKVFYDEPEPRRAYSDSI